MSPSLESERIPLVAEGMEYVKCWEGGKVREKEGKKREEEKDATLRGVIRFHSPPKKI